MTRVCRASYSSYQTQKSLAQEKEAINNLGLDYTRCKKGPEPKELQNSEILLINSSYPVTAELLEEWPTGELIITTTSGYDHIDLQACTQQKIRVARTPRSRGARVSEHTLGLITGLLRDFAGTGRELTKGEWNRTVAFGNSKNLRNQTVGILGFGKIGRKVSDLLRSLVKQPLLIHDPLKKEEIKQVNQLEYVELNELLGRSSVVTLHTDLNPSTRKIICPETIQLMSEGSYLVNTSRGEVIDQNALFEALQSNKLAGAALDVFNREPPEDKRFFENYNLLLTPHAAGFGPGLLSDLRSEIVRTLETFLEAEPLPSPVQPRSETARNRLKTARDKGFAQPDE